MNAVLAILVVGIGYIAFRSGVFNQLLQQSPQINAGPTGALQPTPMQQAIPTGGSQSLNPPGTGTVVGAGIMSGAGAGVGAGVAGGAIVGGITAGVGAVIAIGAALLAAHEARKRQATDENSANNVGVSGFDADMRSINAAYQGGQITKHDVIGLVQTAQQHFWQLVIPHIQPGRNGCNNGNNCSQCRPANYCSGSIGAACCTGCTVINPSAMEVINIMMGNYSKIACDPESVCPCDGGTFWRSIVRRVFPSKYGGIARPPFTLDWKK